MKIKVLIVMRRSTYSIMRKIKNKLSGAMLEIYKSIAQYHITDENNSSTVYYNCPIQHQVG